MRRLVSSASALAADRRAEQDFGYPALLLMEEAGIRLQDRLETLSPHPAVYLAGPGNNGGDALVMARQAFLRGRAAAVVTAFAATTDSARRQLEWAARLGIPAAQWPSAQARDLLGGAALWVDGLWGAGLQGPLRAEQARVVEALETLREQRQISVAAVDVPSGLREGRSADEPVLKASWTLSPGPVKDFCYDPVNRGCCGTLFEVPLSFPSPAEPSAQRLEESDLSALLPPVGADDHKGRRGHVALAGGTAGMTGAIVLAARSAAAAGAGLVSLHVDEALVALVAPQVPAFQVRPFETPSPRYGAWVAGPGWGEGRPQLLEALWGTDRPLVVDADGLQAWHELGRPRRAPATVFTPHPGEFRRLGFEGVADAAGFAREYGLTLVLKGSVTWIFASDGRRAVWDGGVPALGTGGSGDCLAGITAAFLAVGQTAFDAACAAVALHGTAGRELSDAEGWFTADRLPEAVSRLSLACRTAARPL